jgi:hypothetical protein
MAMANKVREQQAALRGDKKPVVPPEDLLRANTLMQKADQLEKNVSLYKDAIEALGSGKEENLDSALLKSGMSEDEITKLKDTPSWYEFWSDKGDPPMKKLQDKLKETQHTIEVSRNKAAGLKLGVGTEAAPATEASVSTEEVEGPPITLPAANGKQIGEIINITNKVTQKTVRAKVVADGQVQVIKGQK